MTVEDDLMQLGQAIRNLKPDVCVPDDPECTLFKDLGRVTGSGPPDGSPPASGCLSEVGTLTSPGTTSTQTITHSLGVAPKLVIIWTTGQSADGSSTDAQFGMGFGVSASSRSSIGSAYPDGGGAGTEDRYHIETAAVALITPGGAVDEIGDINSFSAANFKIDWTVSIAGGVRYHYAILAGDDLEASVSQVVAPLSTGTQNVAHGLSGAPTAVLGISAHNLSAPPAFDGAAETGVSIGASDGTTDRWTGTYASLGSGGTSAQKAAFLSHSQAVDPTHETANIDSIDGTNIVLDWADVDSAEYYYLLAIKGCNAKCGTFTSPTSATTKEVATGLETVSLFLSWGAMRTVSGSVEDNAQLTFGASDGTNHAAAGILTDIGDTQADRFNDDGAAVLVVNHAGTTLEKATASIDGGDVDVVFSVAAAAENEFNYLAIG